mgnify:CR=1 FL=1
MYYHLHNLVDSAPSSKVGFLKIDSIFVATFLILDWNCHIYGIGL